MQLQKIIKKRPLQKVHTNQEKENDANQFAHCQFMINNQQKQR